MFAIPDVVLPDRVSLHATRSEDGALVAFTYSEWFTSRPDVDLYATASIVTSLGFPAVVRCDDTGSPHVEITTVVSAKTFAAFFNGEFGSWSNGWRARLYRKFVGYAAAGMQIRRDPRILFKILRSTP